MRLGPLAVAVTVAVTACVAIAGTRLPAGTRAGVYSGDQAEQGAQVYAQQCAICHGATLAGTFETPGLTGKFVANWGNKPLGDLYDYLGRAMPQYAPGTLTPQDNARLVAFLLKANGMPAGRDPLPADSAALHAIAFEPVVPTR